MITKINLARPDQKPTVESVPAASADVPNTSGETLEELLAAAHQLSTAVSNTAAFGGSGRSVADFLVLQAAAAGGQQRVSQLANSLRMAKPSLNRILRTLEAGGLLQVALAPADGKTKTVVLTPAGVAAQSEMRRQLHAFASKLSTPLSKRQAIMSAVNTTKRLAKTAWKLRKKAGDKQTATEA